MLPQSCWVLLLLLLCAAFGGLGFSTPSEQVLVWLHSSHEEEEEEEGEGDGQTGGVDLFNCQANPEGPWTLAPQNMEELSLETSTQDSLLHPMLDQPLHAQGQHRLAKLLEDITQGRGNLSTSGAAELQEGQQVVHPNLHNVQDSAQDVYSQLERDLDLLLAQWQRMEEVMEKLQQVNQSLGLMLAAVEDAQSQVEKHLQHLHTVLHPAGQSPSVISTCTLYGSYLVLLVALLVSTPPRSITLLFLTSSTFSELLGFPGLPTLLALAITGQWLVVASRAGAGRIWLMLPQEKPQRWLTSTPDRECDLELLQEELDQMEMSCLQESSCLEKPPVMAGDIPGLAGQVLPIPSGWRTKLSSSGVVPEPVLGAGKHWELQPYNLSRSLTREVSLLSPRSPCQGLTRAGQRCRKKATPGQDFCHLHVVQPWTYHPTPDLLPPPR